MKFRILVGISACALVTAAGSAVFLADGSAHGASQATLSVSAPTLGPVESSTHNAGLSPVCGSQVAPVAGSEFDGTLQNGAGSYVGDARLPQGATVKTLRLTVHDFTNPGDAHLYLVRKNLLPQTTFTGKYAVVASVASNGAVNQPRQFTSSAVSNGTVDNTKFAYSIELVNCDSTIQPIGVQIVYNTP